MRPHLREFLELCAETLECAEPIVEIGSFQVAGQEKIANLRPLFVGKQYIGCDMQPGPGVDRLEDIHQLSFRRGEVGLATVLMPGDGLFSLNWGYDSCPKSILRSHCPLSNEWDLSKRTSRRDKFFNASRD